MLLDLGNGLYIDPEAQLREFDRCDFEDSLYMFLRAAWGQGIDPAPWADSWAIEAIAEHLQAVADGEIKRFILNLPPRFGKSSVCSVAFPAWLWAQEHVSSTSGPGVPILGASYSTRLALRDSVRCRRLIESPWYQSMWGHRFRLTTDQNTKTRFQNDKGGERLITSVDAGVTGEGGNCIILDDPNAANEVSSEATIQSTIDWWDGTMSTRLNDAKAGAFVVVQQRLAENDLSGHILEKSRGEWTHLMLPMRYDKDRAFVNGWGWKDPRTKDGDLLWPERFGEAEVVALERSLGPYGASGQLQQSPSPKGGGIIKREWWKLWEDDKFPPMDFILGVVDTAYTEKEENDPSAMVVWGVFSHDPVAQASRMIGPDGRPMFAERTIHDAPPKVMLMNAWDERLPIHELAVKINGDARRFKIDLLIIENKAAGISVAQELRRLFANENYGVQLDDPKSQDKMSRLYSVQHIFAEHMVYSPDRSWADKVITQVAQFPKAKHDEYADCTSAGLRKLRDMGLLTRAQERLEEIEASKQYHGKPPEPLYPC